MVDNQHKLIQDYRGLRQDEIDAINEIKQAELALGKLWESIMDADGESFSADGRWMSIARTHFEQGFMAFVRAIAKPENRF